MRLYYYILTSLPKISPFYRAHVLRKGGGVVLFFWGAMHSLEISFRLRSNYSKRRKQSHARRCSVRTMANDWAYSNVLYISARVCEPATTPYCCYVTVSTYI